MRADVQDEVGVGRSQADDIGFVQPKKIRARMDVTGIERDVGVLWNDQVRLFSALGIVVTDQGVQRLPQRNGFVEQGTRISLICTSVAIPRLAEGQTVVESQDEEEEQGDRSKKDILASFPSRGLPLEHDRMVRDGSSNLNRKSRRSGGRVVLA